MKNILYHSRKWKSVGLSLNTKQKFKCWNGPKDPLANYEKTCRPFSVDGVDIFCNFGYHHDGCYTKSNSRWRRVKVRTVELI